MRRSSMFILAAGFLAASCTIDDDDRCPDGFVWNGEFQSCECDVDGGFYLEIGEDDSYSCHECTDSDTHTDCAEGGDADTDTDTDADADTDADSDADGGSDADTDTDTDADTGLGTECTSSEDCAEFEADYCAISPLAPSDPGYCTFENCNPGECPTPYMCCDLSGLGYGIACLNEADATTAQGFGATCN